MFQMLLAFVEDIDTISFFDRHQLTETRGSQQNVHYRIFSDRSCQSDRFRATFLHDRGHRQGGIVVGESRSVQPDRSIHQQGDRTGSLPYPDQAARGLQRYRPLAYRRVSGHYVSEGISGQQPLEAVAKPLLARLSPGSL